MIINVKVKPNAREEFVEELAKNEYLVHVKEKAEDDKANNRVINLLAKRFKTSYKNIIIKTPKSRDKIIEIIDL